MDWLKFIAPGPILALIFPVVAPKTTMDLFDKAAFGTVIGIAIWSILGSPDISKTSIELPAIASVQSTAQQRFAPVPFPQIAHSQPSLSLSKTTPSQRTPVVCPASIQVVNIRKEAGLTPIVAQVPCGQVVQVMQGERRLRNGEIWVPVSYQGRQGWSAGRFLAQ